MMGRRIWKKIPGKVIGKNVPSQDSYADRDGRT